MLALHAGQQLLVHQTAVVHSIIPFCAVFHPMTVAYS